MITPLRKLLAPLLLCAMIAVPGMSFGALIDRGGGLIYDTVLDVTWLQDASYARTSGYGLDGMTWEDSVTWATNLSYYDSVRNVTYTDWRLPSVTPVNGVSFNYSNSYDGSSDYGFHITNGASELSYMFYINLENTASRTTTGASTFCYKSFDDSCLDNVGPFINLIGTYWSGAEYGLDPTYAWVFSFGFGNQVGISKSYVHPSAWAVRDGDVAAMASMVPVPTAIWLLGSGLLGLVCMAKRNKMA